MVVVLIVSTSVLVVVDQPNKYLASEYLRKAWLRCGHAFFVLLLAALSWQVAADCALEKTELKALQPIEISKVIDGDSVALADGQQLRLIGINTPEIKYQQPLSGEAKEFLQQLLADQKLYLQMGQEEKDRYGRLLGHLYLENGDSVEQLILERGLGFLVAIPPNLELLPCLQLARDEARKSKKGVWSKQDYHEISSQKVSSSHAGFARVKGKVVSVTEGDKGWWIQMDGKVVLRIVEKHLSAFDLEKLRALQGNTVIASGWMVDRSNSKVVEEGYSPFMLVLTHPVHVELQ